MYPKNHTVYLCIKCIIEIPDSYYFHRRLMQTACGITVSQNVVIAMSGMAKVLVGEVVELGCQARDTLGETGPLQPKHVREAVRKLRQQNKIVNSRHKTRRELTK